jgi:hypothetical protein
MVGGYSLCSAASVSCDMLRNFSSLLASLKPGTDAKMRGRTLSSTIFRLQSMLDAIMALKADVPSLSVIPYCHSILHCSLCVISHESSRGVPAILIVLGVLQHSNLVTTCILTGGLDGSSQRVLFYLRRMSSPPISIPSSRAQASSSIVSVHFESPAFHKKPPIYSISVTMKLFGISALLTIVGISIASPVVERIEIEKRQAWTAQAASCSEEGGASFCCDGPLQPGGGSSGLLGGLNLGLLPLTC